MMIMTMKMAHQHLNGIGVTSILRPSNCRYTVFIHSVGIGAQLQQPSDGGRVTFGGSAHQSRSRR